MVYIYICIGIYSNILGFFGGVTWAILLVKTCLSIDSRSRKPVVDSCSSCSELLGVFFKMWHEWSWGAANPVYLRALPPQLVQFLNSIRPATAHRVSTSANGNDVVIGASDSIEEPRVQKEPPQYSEPPSSESFSSSTSAATAAVVLMWDPSINEADRRSLMPVLTPVVPYMNSTFNTLATTQRILLDEFRRGTSCIVSLVIYLLYTYS